jgi:ADP-L-glycero-D-manno-heptose 6-epimerase
MLWLRDNPTISGLFNLGTGQARSWWDMAKAMFAAVNRACTIEFMDMPVEMSVSYQNYTQADIGKLRSAGYDRPFTSLEDGVRDYISNYLAKDDIYR